jgi:replication initiation protein RepC
MSLGMLANQQRAETIQRGTSRNKWKLFRAICEARPLLGVSDRALTVLDALLTFYPSDEISAENGLIVFPSNAQLSIRARGMTAATLRRHLCVLIDAGLILRKDSPNGKRYARRNRAGGLNEAFGFSLSPLLARAREIESLAAQVIADRELLRVTKERLTLCKRDITKLIETAITEGLPGDWAALFTGFRALIDQVPRTATLDMLLVARDRLAVLRDDIVNQLKSQVKTEKMSASESHIERHIQDSYPDSLYELEPRLEQEALSVGVSNTTISEISPTTSVSTGAHNASGANLKSFPLDLVLRACPEMSAYGPSGRIRTWRDLMTAAVTVRSMLGVTPSAYQQACNVMGPENAATVIACILERAGHISSPGGYLRDLSRRTERGVFAVGPMLMSLVRATCVSKSADVAPLSGSATTYRSVPPPQRRVSQTLF